jgi:hypothetical protein
MVCPVVQNAKGARFFQVIKIRRSCQCERIFDFPTAGENFCRSGKVTKLPLTWRNRRVRGRCVSWWL